MRYDAERKRLFPSSSSSLVSVPSLSWQTVVSHRNVPFFAAAFGGKGYFCVTPEELEAALDEAMATRPYKPTIINTMISLTSLRKKQAFASLDFKSDFSRL